MFDLNPLDRSTAILEIVILLLIAAIIGFITAWLYYRRIYRKKIAELEAEFAAYRATHVPQADLDAANKALAEMTDERNILRVELTAAENHVRTAQAELSTTRQERDRLRTEKLELSTQLAERNAALEKCGEQGIELKAQLDQTTAENERLDAAVTNLESQIGESKLEIGRLEAALEACRNQDGGLGIPAVPAVPPVKKPTAKDKKAASLEAVRAKRGTINFGRIGDASADEADDLKEIKGIGPFIEEKLNALGIFTFAQIAKFTEEDTEAVTKAIAFFPGRIQRDDWAGQAKEK